MRSRWLDVGQVKFCVVIDRDGVQGHKHGEKNRTKPISSNRNRTSWSILDLLNRKRILFPCGKQLVVPNGQDGAILPAREANLSAGYDLFCWPARGPIDEAILARLELHPVSRKEKFANVEAGPLKFSFVI